MSNQQPIPAALAHLNLTPEQYAVVLKEAAKANMTDSQRAQADRDALKDLTKEAVMQGLADIEAATQALEDTKTRVYGTFRDILEEKRRLYGIKVSQKTHSFSVPSVGAIILGYRAIEDWDDTVNEGIAKIDEFLASLKNHNDATKDALVDMVSKSLKKTKSGELRASSVLELQNMKDKFNDPLFSEGVDIISKAKRSKKSAWFIEGTKIDKDTGKSIALPLNISAVNFPAHFDTAWLGELWD
jgi:hypothetical protein